VVTEPNYIRAGRCPVNSTAFLELIQNAALLLAVAFIFDIVAIRWRTELAVFWQTLAGFALGVIGITLMLTSWTFIPGIIFDTRSILLGISGVFFGVIPTLIAMAMTAAFRVHQGGAATLVGVCVILSSGTIGLAWRRFCRRPLAEIPWRELYLFGMLIHIVMLALMFTLPWETALRVLSNIALPVLVIFPVATTLLGALMVNRLRREVSEETLRENEQFLNDTQAISKIGGWVYDVGKNRVKWTDETYRIYGVSRDYDPSSIDKSMVFYSEEDQRTLSEAFKDAVENGESYDLQLRVTLADGTRKWVRTIGTPVRNGGKIVNVIGSIMDITERKEAEEVLLDATERLSKSLDGTVQAVSMVVEARDPYTAGHQKRTADLAKAIAEEMGFPEDRVEFIRIAASIHDIGKIAVPAEILSKPAKLTEVEFSLVKVHPVTGHDILRDIDFFWPIADVVLQHHERMDGSGYPNGLTGKDILPEARVLAVADVIEAILSHRPYRSALGLDFALEEISANRGILYDPEVVGTCLKLFQEKGFHFH